MSFDNKIYRPVLLEGVLDSLSSNVPVALVGMRGVGKTHLAREVAARFQGRHGRTSVFWMDLEDPRLLPGPTRETASVFLRSMRRDPSLVVLDEVAHLEGWQQWCRETCEKTKAPVLVTLSANTRLVGGQLESAGVRVFRLFPLALREQLEIINDISVDTDAARRWLNRGGLPAVAYSPDHNRSCFDLLYDILFRDIALAREIRDVAKLIDMSIYLVESSGSPVSLTSMRKHGMGSIDKTRSFLAAIEHTGLISMVDRVEDLGRDRHQAGRLVFSGDLGMVAALSRGPISTRRLGLTAVFGELERLGTEVAAWKHGGTTGLCQVEDGRVDLLVDVAREGSGKISWRSLSTAARNYGAERVLVLGQDEHEWDMNAPGCRIMVRNLWNWLSDPTLDPHPAGLAAAGTKKARPGGGDSAPGRKKGTSVPGVVAEEEREDSGEEGGLPPYLL